MVGWLSPHLTLMIIKRFALCIVQSTIFFAWAFGLNATATDRPNILYIAPRRYYPHDGLLRRHMRRLRSSDQLAAEGIRHTNAHSVAPARSVSRSSIVAGMYPSTIGTLHHRSGGLPAPTFLKFVPNLMGEAGYYTTNQKSDYNIVGMKYDRQGKKVETLPGAVARISVSLFLQD